MTYPISFYVTSAENILRTENPYLSLAEIRDVVFNRVKDNADKLQVSDDGTKIRLEYKDGSTSIHDANLDAPTMAQKAFTQIQHIGRNEFNVKDNIGGVQGHSQGNTFPFVVGSFGNGDWGVWYGGKHIRFAAKDTAFAFAEHCKAQGIKNADTFAAYGESWKGA